MALGGGVKLRLGSDLPHAMAGNGGQCVERMQCMQSNGMQWHHVVASTYSIYARHRTGQWYTSYCTPPPCPLCIPIHVCLEKEGGIPACKEYSSMRALFALCSHTYTSAHTHTQGGGGV